MQKSDLLWALYLSEREFIQHHENQRTNASNILAAISAGVMIALGTDKLSAEVSVMLSVLLIALGLFGWIFCAKLYALIKLHAERSYQYLDVLDQEVAAVQIASLKQVASDRNNQKFRKLKNLGLNKIWAWFHQSILCAGVLFLGINGFSLMKSLSIL